MNRMLLEFDETTHAVRPTEQQSPLDRSAGPGGAGLQWSTQRRIVFFRVEQERAFGLRLDERGRFVPRLCYAYTFDLQEMEAPFFAAITESGWQRHPTAMRGPAWLSWLTG